MKEALSRNLVSVIVVSCQRENLLSLCLESIAAQTYRHIECVVLLNSSNPCDIQKWHRIYPGFIFDYYAGNELYCRPQNHGIAMSRGDFILCLNDDIVLSPSYVEKILQAALCRPQAGAVSGCLLRQDGRTIDSTGLFWTFSRKPWDRGYGKKLAPAYLKEGYIFGVNGAAAFYRRQMLESVKINGEYFDEDFGIYYEDFDLAWRAQKLGWKAFYCPQAIAYHKRGATARQDLKLPMGFLKNFAIASLPQGLKVRLIRNRYAAMIKNDGLFSFIGSLPWICFYELRLMIYLVFFDRHVLKELLEDKNFLMRAREKRKKISNLKKLA